MATGAAAVPPLVPPTIIRMWGGSTVDNCTQQSPFFQGVCARDARMGLPALPLCWKYDICRCDQDFNFCFWFPPRLHA